VIRRLSNFLPLLALAGSLRAATYEVGPNKPLTAIGQVPWENLQPGDTVLIHARPEPYREKIFLGCVGTSNSPIAVRGVADATGQLPVLAADGATTRTNLDFWTERRSLVKIGGGRIPADVMPAWIVIENLDLRGARPPHKFTGARGQEDTYAKNAAAIHVEKCEHLTIRRCRLHDCGNGLFVSSNDDRASRDIRVEGCEIFDNGFEKSGYEHNVYTTAIGMAYVSNWFGPLREDCWGNNLKDRSAGLVIRGNRIEGGNKCLDLVDAQDSRLIRADPTYADAVVADNLILKLPRDGHSFVVHYGGDGTNRDFFRPGPLVFTNNTIVSSRIYTTTLFRLSSPAQRCVFANNLIQATHPKGKIAVLENAGAVELHSNWFTPGWRATQFPKPSGHVHDDGSTRTNAAPEFMDARKNDFRLAPNSPLRAAGIGALHPATAP
jgi:hypothetical protein